MTFLLPTLTVRAKQHSGYLPDDKKRKSLVLIATYNERENLSTLVRSLLALPTALDLLVVDDNSPDGTGELADDLAASSPRVNVIHRPQKDGVATALSVGFRWGLEQGYESVINMDGDWSHDPKEVLALLRQSNTKALVIGSRYQGGIRVNRWPLPRLLLSLVAARYVQWLTQVPVCDPTSGFRCFGREALSAVVEPSFLSRGFSVHIETTCRIWRKGMPVIEIPIHFSDRCNGESKLSIPIIWEAIWLVLRLAQRRDPRSEDRKR